MTHDHPYKRVEFIGQLTYDTTKACKMANFKPAFYTTNSIGKRIFNTKVKIDKLDQSGVYKLQCNNCSSSYIGQSGRKISTRFKEHRMALNNFGVNSEMADHAREFGHTFDVKGIKVLHQCKKGQKMNLLENIEINKNLNGINIQIPILSSPLIQPFANTPFLSDQQITNSNTTPHTSSNPK